jgi:hypothetical protein
MNNYAPVMPDALRILLEELRLLKAEIRDVKESQRIMAGDMALDHELDQYLRLEYT